MSLERLRVSRDHLRKHVVSSVEWFHAVDWTITAILEHLIQQEEAKQKETG